MIKYIIKLPSLFNQRGEILRGVLAKISVERKGRRVGGVQWEVLDSITHKIPAL